MPKALSQNLETIAALQSFCIFGYQTAAVDAASIDAFAAREGFSGGNGDFTPSTQWQEVPPEAVLPPGLEIRMDLSSGRQQARVPPGAEPPPTARSTGGDPRTLKDRVAGVAERSADPEAVDLADFRAARRAEEMLKEVPVDETADTAQEFLDDALEQADEVRRALGLNDEEFARVFAELDEEIAEAQALGRAARAAALCDLRK